MPLPANELARRDARGLMLAPDPVRVTWTLEDLPAADGHALRCRVSCGVRPVNEPAELRMLQDVLMGPRPAPGVLGSGTDRSGLGGRCQAEGGWG